MHTAEKSVGPARGGPWARAPAHLVERALALDADHVSDRQLERAHAAAVGEPVHGQRALHVLQVLDEQGGILSHT